MSQRRRDVAQQKSPATKRALSVWTRRAGRRTPRRSSRRPYAGSGSAGSRPSPRPVSRHGVDSDPEFDVTEPMGKHPIRDQANQPGRETLWSPAGATSSNRRQIARARERQKQATTVAVGCDRSPRVKEEVVLPSLNQPDGEPAGIGAHARRLVRGGRRQLRGRLMRFSDWRGFVSTDCVSEQLGEAECGVVFVERADDLGADWEAAGGSPDRRDHGG